MDLKKRARQLKPDIPVVFLCMKDKNTPAIVKVLADVTIAYALSPVDLIPDFIPVLGYLDDVILLLFLIALTIRFIPQELFEHYSVSVLTLQLSQKAGDNKAGNLTS